MSGGSYNYAFSHVDEAAETLLRKVTGRWDNYDREMRYCAPEEALARRQMVTALQFVAKAMKELEWYDSDDRSDWPNVVESFRAAGEALRGVDVER